MRGGIIILETAPHQQDGEHLPTHQMLEQFVILWERRGNFAISTVFVLGFEDYMNRHYFGFVDWLDAAMNSGPDHSVD